MHICCFSMSSNLSNYIGIRYAKGQAITYIYPKLKKPQRDITLLDRLTFKSYLTKNSIKEIDQIEVDISDINALKHIIDQLPADAVILLPPLTRGPHINLYEVSFSQSRKCLFVEPDGDVYEITKNGAISMNDDDVSLSIKHFIQQTNGYILQTNTTLFKEQASNELLDYLISNLEIFQHIFKTIRPLKKVELPLQHPNAYDSSPSAIVNLAVMRSDEQLAYLEALNLLKRHNILNLKTLETTIEVEFLDVRYKDYFSKSGTWLEHYTQRALENIEEIVDVNSSVMFVWDKGLQHLQNEIDVMALTENQLINISCKDTAKLLETYLYILESHSEQLAEDVIKIVVCTTAPNKLISDRANRLGVHIVVFEKNAFLFQKNIREIILRYRA